jgi:small subunit ribosomal protein S17
MILSQIEVKAAKRQRTFKGVVVSAAMNKTRIVLVSRSITHPKYNKRYKVSRRYPAHDEKNEYKVGQAVVIQETRPLSKTKRWKIISHQK